VRRILVWALSTLAVLVFLLSYHTSTSSQFAATQQMAVRERTAGSGNLPRSGSFDGDLITTRFGTVQVRITVAGGRITSAEALRWPNSDRHDRMINDRAVPILNAEVVRVQTAQVDLVSGATLTSQGYQQSLQSAIDKANA
jgi:uncharacterized protein with FMN-binding domain